jgi:hypothetical protein
MAVTRLAHRDSCLGQTCLKWQADGELSPVDRQAILDRLLQVDGCSPHGEECWVFRGFPNP